MKKLKMMAAVMAMAATVTLLGVPIQARAAEEDFDPVFYAETYPDVVAVIGTDAEALYNHYINNGKAEGRLTHAEGDTDTVATPQTALPRWTELSQYLTNAPVIDLNAPVNEEVRQMLEGIELDEELRTVLLHIGIGTEWGDEKIYDCPIVTGEGSIATSGGQACGAFANIMSNMIYGAGQTCTPLRHVPIQQYDIVAPAGLKQAHDVFVLYVDPNTGKYLAAEGNYGGKTNIRWWEPKKMDTIMRVQ